MNAVTAPAQTPTGERLLFLGTADDQNHLPRLKQLVGVATIFVVLAPVTTLAEIVLYCQKRNITGVITNNQFILGRLLGAMGNPKTSPSLSDYAGSYFTHKGIEFVIVAPLEQLVTVSYMPMVMKRYITKLTEPASWMEVPEFNWDILTPTNWEVIYEKYSHAFAISVDTETLKLPVSLRCIGYTAIFISPTGVVSTHSCVLPIEDMFSVGIMRKFNWELKAPKILQNGKYDCAYLAMYNAVLYNYLWDTANLFHCWYSELPKDLAFLGAFMVRKAMYWKDLANTTDLHEYYRYNALDTWTTVNVWVAMLMQMPAYARRNYLQEFPLVFPCHLSEMTGMKRDMVRLGEESAKCKAAIEADNISLSKMVGTYPNIFNVNSAPQNKSLRIILGCGDLTSSDEKHLKKIGERHPLNKRIANKILDIRGNRKLDSTYLTIGETAKEFYGRILYALNPHGTDSGRLASREHHFWCGLQLQNIPRESPDTAGSVKRTIVADEGFLFFENDLEQAESRDTAYISGDVALIAAVSSSQDFHSINASAFFGVPYASIYSDELKKTLDKALRDIAKRVNHGANYLMGPAVLVDTMGEPKVWEAKKLLKLPAAWGLLDVATYLLKKFHETYPSLASCFYPAVVAEVMTTKQLVSHTYHWTPVDVERGSLLPGQVLEGWTRRCFGNPKANKLDKNSLVAHVPQNLNAMTLNKAYMRVFYEVAIHPVHHKNYKLCGQIHDSILQQIRIGHEYLAVMVKEMMEIPVTVLGYDGKTRTFTVPSSIKGGKDGKGAKYWSDTE